MCRPRVSLGVLIASFAVACGGSSDSDPSGAGGASSGSQSGTFASSGSGLGAHECRSDTDCEQGFEMCVHLGEQIPFGGCGESCMSDCQSDAECSALGPNGICLGHEECCGTYQACTNGCGQDADCGEAGVCGADHRCSAKPCGSDGDCPAMYACLGASKTCAPFACADSSTCGEGNTCGPEHQCAATPCAADADCTANFRCGEAQTCVRITCQQDSACQGFCVEGACYAMPGKCEGLPS